MYRRISLLTLLFFTLIFTQAQNPKREMRAVWIATVANIDWPSQRNLTSKSQRDEMRTMLDELAKNNINTIIYQVRPTADAFYCSTLEPWSQWLTNKQGQRPSPFYDPLQFVIEEAHKRCMEVHVWLNPYRVTNSDNTAQLSKDHLFFRNRNLFLKYGDKYYFNPGLDQTREFLNKVVEDIVERYDIDAVHFDDYFYPYPIPGSEFPDDDTFKANPRGFQPNQKADWRRNNVNMVISELQQTIKSIKPWVEFGVSPFGVWRNNNIDPRGSDTKAGCQNYDDLYADILKWLKEGTIDYVVPQLYWEIGKKVANYEVLAKWWSENAAGKNLYIGLYASQLGMPEPVSAAWRNGNELCRQLRLNKQYPQIDGAVYFSAKPFLKNKQNLNDSLKQTFYKYPALTPVNRNIRGLSSMQPTNIRIVKDGSQAYLIWDDMNNENTSATAYFVIYAFKGKKVGDLNDPANILLRTTEKCIDLRLLETRLKGYYTFVVTAVNRYKNESEPAFGVTRKL